MAEGSEEEKGHLEAQDSYPRVGMFQQPQNAFLASQGKWPEVLCLVSSRFTPHS